MRYTNWQLLPLPLKVLPPRCHSTELTWFSFWWTDQWVSSKAVMHYSRHRLTALVAYLTIFTYSSTSDQWAHPAWPLVSSWKSEAVRDVNFFQQWWCWHDPESTKESGSPPPECTVITSSSHCAQSLHKILSTYIFKNVHFCFFWQKLTGSKT